MNHKIPILDIKNITMQFGGLTAVSNFSMQVYDNELLGLIGPNGAGKTTIFNMVTGVYTPTSGDIALKGQKINELKTYQVAQAGLARTFQNIRLFKDLSTFDNIRLACHQRMHPSLCSTIFRTKKYREAENRIKEKTEKMLEVFNLKEHRYYLAKNLPYGLQRKLEMARALATEPSILLLDEPAAGMNPQETKDLTELIAFIRREFKIAIVLIEHDMKLVMSICEKVSVVVQGELVAHGEPKEIQNNPKVIEAYLGVEEG